LTIWRSLMIGKAVSRYEYIIELGRELPLMNDELHTPDRIVKGCQSNVWLDIQYRDQKLYFIVDSDALIVRGLLALLLAAYNGKTAKDISQFNIDDYFQSLDLERHLSLTRGNGLRAMVAKIRISAAAILADNYIQSDW